MIRLCRSGSRPALPSLRRSGSGTKAGAIALGALLFGCLYVEPAPQQPYAAPVQAVGAEAEAPAPLIGPPEASPAPAALAPSEPEIPAQAPAEPQAPLIRLSCAFEGGFVAVIPPSLADLEDPRLMGVLVGLARDPERWEQAEAYASLGPFAARPCGSEESPTEFRLVAGEHLILAGWDQAPEGAPNGFTHRLTLDSDQLATVSLEPGHLSHRWACVDCPTP